MAALKQGRVYKCPKCGGRLENPPPAPTAPAGSGLRLEGERDPRRWEIPVRLGRYIVEGEIGRGAMGVVYRARQEGLDRVVAIKMMLAGWAQDPDARKRFHREARTAARLRHPNIVAIHEIGTYRGAPFFTMDYVEGVSLEKRLAERPMTPREAARLVRDLARAMEHAHAHGVLHRDLKPSNILIDKDGVPHITDFGLAKDLHSESILSMTGDVMGTPGYMAPEQAEGNVHQLDARADVYALGAILYRCLVGRPPFEGPTVAATIYAIVNEFALEPAKLRKDIPAALNAIVMKAIEKDRERRYASAADLAQDLDNFLHGRAVSAAPPAAGRKVWERIRRHKVYVFAAAGAAVVAVAAVLALLLLRPSALEQLRAQLDSENAGLREAAFRGLVQEIVAPRAIRDTDAAIRLVREYGMAHSDPATREVVVAGLEPPGVCERLWSSLGEVVRAWLPQTDPPDLAVRQIRLAARAADRPSVPALLALTRVPEKEIKVAAVEALGAIGDLMTFPRLAELIVDPDAGPAAREAMRRIRIERAVLFGPGAGGDVTGALTELGEHMAQYQRQRDSLMQPDGETPQQMAIAKLRSGTPEEKVRAALFLSSRGDAEAEAPLMEAISAGPDAVSILAADALVELRLAQPDRLEPLLRAGPPHAKKGAAHALGRLGGPRAQEMLQRALTEERDAGVRRAILAALGALTPER